MSLMEKFLQNADAYEMMFEEWHANGGFPPPDQELPPPSASSSRAGPSAGQDGVKVRRTRVRGGKNKEFWGKYFAAKAGKPTKR